MALAATRYALGGWRQILWQVPGHYDHIHVAHQGGMVEASWGRSWWDKADERTAQLQVGETVLPKGFKAARIEVWDPPTRKGRHHDDRRPAPAVVINGNVQTTDIGEFFDHAEKLKRRAYALAAPTGV